MAASVHLIGSVPLDDAEMVFRTVTAVLGPHLRRLPDGETGERRRWIWFQRQMLERHPAMEADPTVPLFALRQWDGKLLRETPLLRFREGVDPEELHSMRVATRRMRAAWRVFGDGFRPDRTARYRRRLRVVAARLGAVRDLDVLIDATVAFTETLPSAERDGLEPLIDAWRDQREANRRLLIAELDSGRYRRFVDDYRDFVLTPGAEVQPIDPTTPHRVRDTAGSRIWTAYERVRAFESVLKWADVPTLHRLRIEAKRLRYTLEFVREALGPEAPALIQRVVALQDHLGAMNDADVAAHMARGFLVEHAGELSDTQAAAISHYLVAREREVARLKRTVGLPWRGVAGLTFRRALGRTIAAL
jgi:CHAD domain-containing protein